MKVVALDTRVNKAEMEVGIRFWAPILGLSPKNN